MEWELEIKFEIFGWALARKKDKFWSKGQKRWHLLKDVKGCWREMV